MSNYFDRPEHLRALPKLRAAYSDRTSWLLAEMSRLVYEKLPIEDSEVSIVEAILIASRSIDPKKALKKIVKDLVVIKESGDNRVQRNLAAIDFELVDGFASNGTEGFLAKFAPTESQKGFRVLAFRGTEVSSFKDIKTDIKVNLTSAPKGGRAHAGFLLAYREVEESLKEIIKKDSDLPLYITGHSLGGALAMVATRYLDSDQLSATYTYGCPRVADDTFYAQVKSPIYRVINAGDGVPRVPLGFAISMLITGLRLVPINGTRIISEWIRRNQCGYTHWGNVIFLTPLGKPSTVDGRTIDFQLRSSPGIFWRFTIVARRWLNTFGKSLYQDHSMDDYSQKLGDYAEWRNPNK
ncbi:MAG: lipase family protein [Opitutaceae bacterium]